MKTQNQTKGRGGRHRHRWSRSDDQFYPIEQPSYRRLESAKCRWLATYERRASLSRPCPTIRAFCIEKGYISSFSAKTKNQTNGREDRHRHPWVGSDNHLYPIQRKQRRLTEEQTVATPIFYKIKTGYSPVLVLSTVYLF